MTKNIILSLLVLGSFVLISPNILAQKLAPKQDTVLNRFYIQAQTGVYFARPTYFSHTVANFPANDNTKMPAALSGHSFAIGYYLNKNWAVELGYQYNRYQYIYPFSDNLPKGELGNANVIFNRWNRDISLRKIRLPNLSLSFGIGIAVLFHDRKADNTLGALPFESQKISIITWQGNNNIKADTLLLDGFTYRQTNININVDFSAKLLYKTNKKLVLGCYFQSVWIGAMPYEQRWYLQQNSIDRYLHIQYETKGIYTGILLRYLL